MGILKVTNEAKGGIGGCSCGGGTIAKTQQLVPAHTPGFGTPVAVIHAFACQMAELGTKLGAPINEISGGTITNIVRTPWYGSGAG